jgi:hypothetical protein
MFNILKTYCEHGEFYGLKCILDDREYGLSISQGDKWFEHVKETGICPLCDKEVKRYEEWKKANAFFNEK